MIAPIAFRVSLVETGPDGTYIINRESGPPYGRHKIIKVYPDGSSWVMATIDGSCPRGTVLQIAALLAAGVPVEESPREGV